MSRPYSPALLNRVQTASVYKLGLDLAVTCIDANLPASYVAQVFNTTRMTLHSWFRGGEIRFKKRERVELFIKLVEEDMARGLLPCKTLSEARIYLQDMLGSPIKVGSKKTVS